MVIDKIRKMSVKGVKLKSESYFSISPGVLELWRKNLRGADYSPKWMKQTLVSFYLSHFVFIDAFVFLTFAVEIFFNWYVGNVPKFSFVFYQYSRNTLY